MILLCGILARLSMTINLLLTFWISFPADISTKLTAE